MPVIAITSGAHCRGEEIGRKVAETLGYDYLDDQALIASSSGRFGLSESKLRRALDGQASVFNKFTHDLERGAAHLKLCLAEEFRRQNLVVAGAVTVFSPRSIGHVLHVLLIAEAAHRARQAAAAKKIGQKEGLSLVHQEEAGLAYWSREIFHREPWDAALYDLLIPVDKTSTQDAVALMVESAGKPALKPTAQSLSAVEDFILAARVELVLAEKGHQVGVAAKSGRVALTLNKHTLMLSRLEAELKRLASAVEGVQEVETKVGPGFYQPDIYRQFDFETPQRVLLVDDEREFVQTLSERLLMRDVGSAVVFDGEEALSFLKDEEPDVMVLDLKMPGIDGIEVLRRVKRDHPQIEVIILTGHGSQEDERVCLDLGAFAYLQKPVDIELLSEKMRQAYRKIRQARSRP